LRHHIHQEEKKIQKQSQKNPPIDALPGGNLQEVTESTTDNGNISHQQSNLQRYTWRKMAYLTVITVIGFLILVAWLLGVSPSW
jgi:hypothetical protein